MGQIHDNVYLHEQLDWLCSFGGLYKADIIIKNHINVSAVKVMHAMKLI